jgi:PAS domain S-box-containing protein
MKVNEGVFEEIVQTINEGVVYVDLKGKVIFANETFAKLSGIPLNDIVGKNAINLAKKFVSVKDIPRVIKMIQKALSGKNIDSFDLQFNNMYLEINTYYNKKTKRVVGLIWDISEKKSVNDKLKETESLFSNFISNAQDGIIIINDKFEIIDWNEAQERITGYKKKEVFGKKVWDIQWNLAPDDVKERISKEKLKNYFLQFANTGKADFLAGPKDVSIKQKNGSIKHIQQISFPIITEQRMMIGSAVRDVSHEKETSINLEQSEQHLKSIINAIPDLLFTLDINGIITEYKADPSDLYYQKSSIIGKNIQAVLPKDIAGDILNYVNKAIEKDEVCDYEYSLDIPGKGLCFYESKIARKNDTEAVALVRDITEKRLIDEQIKENEERFRHVVESSHDVFYFQNIKTTKIVYVSPKIKDVFGCEVDDFLQLDLKAQKELIHPEDFPYLENFANELINADKHGKQSIERKFRVKHKNGHYIWIEGNYSLLKDNTGHPYIIVGGLHDFTKRREAEQHLMESEKRFKTIFNQAAVGIALVKPDGNFLQVNNRFKEITGYSDSEITKLNFRKITYKDDLDADNKKVQQVLAGEIDSYAIEKRYIHKKGHPIWVKMHSNVVKDEQGNIEYAIAAIQDITEIKETDQALAKSEEKYRKLFEESADPVLLLDYDTFIECNPATVSFLGYNSTAEIEGKKPWELSPVYQPDKKKSKEKALSIINKALKNGHSRFEWVHTDKLGNEKHVDITLTKIPGESEKRIYTIWRDISESKRHERIQKIMTEISSAVNTSSNLEQLARFVQNQLFDIIDATNFSLCTYDPETHTLPFIYKRNEKDTYKKFELGKTLTNYVITTGKSLYGTKTNQQALIKDKKVVLFGNPAKIWLGVPLKIDDTVIGIITLQSFDSEDAYSINDLQLLEHISNHIAIAIKKKQTEEELRKNKDQLQGLFDHMTNGFAYHKIILNAEEKPINYKYLEVNKAFEEEVGLKRKQIIGKNLTDVIPGSEDDPADWIKTYGEVALTGKSIEMEQYSEGLNKWFHIRAYSPEKYYFATTFSDITERKNSEEELRKHREELEVLVKERTQELEEKNARLERMNRLFVDREFRIKELRDKVKELESRFEEENE